MRKVFAVLLQGSFSLTNRKHAEPVTFCMTMQEVVESDLTLSRKLVLSLWSHDAHYNLLVLKNYFHNRIKSRIQEHAYFPSLWSLCELY